MLLSMHVFITFGVGIDTDLLNFIRFLYQIKAIIGPILKVLFYLLRYNSDGKLFKEKEI